MKKLSAAIGILGILAYPSVGVAADTSQCWQVQPQSGAEGWTKWVSPNGLEYGTPANWDTDRAYAELAAAGLCDVGVAKTANTETPETDADLPTQPEPSRVEARALEAQARYGDDRPVEPATKPSKPGGDTSDGIAILVALGGVGFALFGGGKDNDALDKPYGIREFQPASPPAYAPVEPAMAPMATAAPSTALQPNTAPQYSSAPRIEVAAPASALVTDVAQVLADRLRPTLITANPRQGKSMVVAQAYRLAKAAGVAR